MKGGTFLHIPRDILQLANLGKEKKDGFQKQDFSAMRVRLKSGKPLFEVRVQEVQGASRMLLSGSHGGVLPEGLLISR